MSKGSSREKLKIKIRPKQIEQESKEIEQESKEIEQESKEIDQKSKGSRVLRLVL